MTYQPEPTNVEELFDVEIPEIDSTLNAGATPKPRLRNNGELSLLIVKIHQGCQVSFERCYTVTSSRLFGIVLRILRNRADAEEALQDVYVKIWHGCGTFDPVKGEPLGWLAGVAWNCGIDAVRRRHAAGQRALSMAITTDNDGDAIENIATTELPETGRLDHARAAILLQRRLRMLSFDERECLMLAYYSDLSQAQIAERLGRPLGTIKSVMRRGLTNLRNSPAADPWRI